MMQLVFQQMMVSLLALTVLHYSEKNISSRPSQLEHLKVDMGDDLGPNHNPRNRPNIQGEEHEYDNMSRSSRITKEPRSRTSTKPKMQWNKNMKLALAYIVEMEKQKGRWWMRRDEKKWKDSFSMYDVLNMKNLRDMHAKLPDTIKSQAPNENFNLQTLLSKTQNYVSMKNGIELIYKACRIATRIITSRDYHARN